LKKSHHRDPAMYTFILGFCTSRPTYHCNTSGEAEMGEEG